MRAYVYSILYAGPDDDCVHCTSAIGVMRVDRIESVSRVLIPLAEIESAAETERQQWRGEEKEQQQSRPLDAVACAQYVALDLRWKNY